MFNKCNLNLCTIFKRNISFNGKSKSIEKINLPLWYERFFLRLLQNYTLLYFKIRKPTTVMDNYNTK